MERARAEDGISLVEVLVALAILSLVFVGTTATVTGSLQLTRSARAVTVASALATQGMEGALAQGFAGNEVAVASPPTPTTETVDGVEYTISRTVRWVSSSAVTGVCIGTAGAGDTNVLLVEVSVDWQGRSGDDVITQATTLAPPVGLYDPNEGQIAVYVSDAQDPSQPTAGVLVSATATSGVVSNQTTGADGCAVFDALPAGTYTMAVDKLGHIDIDQRVAPDVTRDVAVAAGGRTSTEFRYGQAGDIDVVLAGQFGGQLPADPLQLTLVNTLGIYPKGYGGPATARIEAWPDDYQAFAGGCENADPEGVVAGTPIWPGSPSRGAFGTASTTVAGSVTATLGEVDFAWGLDWFLPLLPLQAPQDVTLVAISVDPCDSPADERVELGPARTQIPDNYALPYGTWRFEVLDGSTVVGESSTSVTVSPTDTSPTDVLLVEGSGGGPTCDTPSYLGRGDRIERVNGNATSAQSLFLETAADPGDLHILTVYAQNAASRVPAGWTLLASQEGGAADGAVFGKIDANDTTVTIPIGPNPVMAQTFAFSGLDGLTLADSYTEADPNPTAGDDNLILDRGVTAAEDDSIVLLLTGAFLEDDTTDLDAPDVNNAGGFGVYDSSHTADEHNATVFIDQVDAGAQAAWTLDWNESKTFETMLGIVLVLGPECSS